MGKPRDLANLVATGNILADGAVAPAELTGVTATASELNILDGVTATATELNLMDGVTTTTAELNHVDGVTSNVQTQMDTKAPVADPTFTGTATAPTINASTALQIGGTAITATATELNVLDGITASTSDLNGVAGINSNVQTQLNLKAPLAGPTFTGTVTIGGTTFPTSDGSAGQILTTNGSGAVSFADPAGGGGQFDAVASGTIANGALVSLNPDGTVTTTTQAVGNSTEFFSLVSYIGADFDSSANKIVVAYRDGTTAKGMAAVGTVSGNSITFGTAVAFNNSNTNARASYISVCYDPNANKTAIIFSDDGASGDKLKGSVGTISGTSISFGTTATLDNSTANYVDTVFDPDQNQIIVSYTDGSDGNHNAVNVVAISGTNISTSHVGSPFGANEAVRNRVVYDTNANKVVFFGIDDNFASNNGRGRAVVGTNSGTAMTFGSATTFNTTGDNGEEVQQQFGAAFDSTANKVVVAFRDGRDGNKGKAKTGTVSGTSITFGATATFSSTNTTEVNAVYDSNSNRTFITFRDDGDSDKGVVNAAAIIGTNLSLSGKIAYSPSTGNSKENVPVVDSNSNKLVVFLEDASDDNAGDAVVCDTTGVDNFLKWIGFASAAISNSATGTINVLGGINESQSSLEVGATLFLTDAAALSTTAVSGREVGKALSATKILITQGSVS